MWGPPNSHIYPFISSIFKAFNTAFATSVSVMSYFYAFKSEYMGIKLYELSNSLPNVSVTLSIQLIKGAILMIVASGNSFKTAYSPKNFVFKSIEFELGSTPNADIWINRFTPSCLANFASLLGIWILTSSNYSIFL